MACSTKNIKFQLRRDTSTRWTSANPVLLDGEPGYETDTYKLKIGDGITPWQCLPYVNSGGSGTGTRGPTGASGATGPKGDTGPTGIQGLKGDTGADGTIGPKGDTGPTGIQGPTGDALTGPSGTRGVALFYGPSGPSGPYTGTNPPPQPGDIFIDTSTGALSVYT